MFLRKFASGLFPWGLGWLLTLATGCSTPITPSRNLELYNQAGQLVMSARLILPAALPPPEQKFSGSWSLYELRPSFPASHGWTQTGPGYAGTVQSDGSVSIDLNAPIMDNNVVLYGKPMNGEMTGEWDYNSIIGGQRMGTFTLKPAAP